MSDVMTAPADQQSALPPAWPALIDLKFVTQQTGFSSSTIYRLMAEDPPAFPVARKAGHSTLWLASEVWEWIVSRPTIQVGKRHG